MATWRHVRPRIIFSDINVGCYERECACAKQFLSAKIFSEQAKQDCGGHFSSSFYPAVSKVEWVSNLPILRSKSVFKTCHWTLGGIFHHKTISFEVCYKNNPSRETPVEHSGLRIPVKLTRVVRPFLSFFFVQFCHAASWACGAASAFVILMSREYVMNYHRGVWDCLTRRTSLER